MRCLSSSHSRQIPGWAAPPASRGMFPFCLGNSRRGARYPGGINRGNSGMIQWRWSSGTSAAPRISSVSFPHWINPGFQVEQQGKTQPGAEGLGMNKRLWNDRTPGLFLWEYWSDGKAGKGFSVSSFVSFTGIKGIILGKSVFDGMKALEEFHVRGKHPSQRKKFTPFLFF